MRPPRTMRRAIPDDSLVSNILRRLASKLTGVSRRWTR